MPASGSLFDVVASLACVYGLTAVICSAVWEFVASALQFRQKALARTVRDLCGETDEPGQPNSLADRILEHPTIRKLRSPGKTGPSYLSARLFTGALIDELAGLARASGPARPHVSDLVSAAPNPDLRRTLALFADEANLDRQGFRARIEDWYEDAMDRATGWYRRRSRAWILLFAVAVALCLNLDTLQIARAVWMAPVDIAHMDMAPAAMPKTDVAMPIGWSTLSGAVTAILDSPVKILGFLITAVAVSIFADLWFSLLRQRGALRAAGGVPVPRSGMVPLRADTAGPTTPVPCRGEVDRAESDLEASDLTRDDIEDIQRALGMTGRFLNGRLDAVTRSMIEEYQLSVGRRPTGILTPYLVERLLASADR
ncbi:MAG: hypothetical protein P1U88_04130 [Thalassobaculaceae bacterium]|nr:hypothetical protein [Thalassobaculaceae bacterium]